jgi:IS5 family transposase
MYKYTSKQIRLPGNFFLPFGGKLNPENRWVILSSMIPWEEFEEEYAINFKKTKRGQEAYNVRIALGSLIIKERLGLSDEETVNQITENPYLQYFLGFESYTEKRPFDPSQLTHFRKRFPEDMLNRINETIIKHGSANDDGDDDDGTLQGNSSNEETKEIETENSGTLILDATCTPADIQYPTDIRLLNDARELLEGIIDILHNPDKGITERPRTYRQKARKEYLSFTKQRKPKSKRVHKIRGKILRYIRRQLKFIERFSNKDRLTLLNRQQYKNLLVISELYRQQLEMYKKKTTRIEDRIVSISQPHVRPIVRGKASASTEFGAKVEISVENGFVRSEIISWDAFNEGTTLKDAVERYKNRNGFYPEVVLADKIYRNRKNREYCKGNNIRLSGPSLGRKTEKIKKEEQKLEYLDNCNRNQVEGKFGEGKRKYSLGKIMTKLAETSATTIVLSLIVMNLEKKLRLLSCLFIKCFETIKIGVGSNTLFGFLDLESKYCFH